MVFETYKIPIYCHVNVIHFIKSNKYIYNVPTHNLIIIHGIQFNSNIIFNVIRYRYLIDNKNLNILTL